MSKRIIRIAGDKIRPFLDKLKGTVTNIVLKSGLTFHGRLTTIEQNGIIIEDTRSHQHFFQDKDIYEIVYDHFEPQKNT